MVYSSHLIGLSTSVILYSMSVFLHPPANMSFLALVSAKHGISPQSLTAWSLSQIHYMLGDGGRSLVVVEDCKGPGVSPADEDKSPRQS